MFARAPLSVLSGLFVVLSGTALAGSLQLAPVLVEVPPPAAAGKITLKNPQATVLAVQVRVYRWSQANGKEQLFPTHDVVASPPIAEIAPRSEQVVRLVRLSKDVRPQEDSYRLIIDELPGQAVETVNSVRFAVRYSVPVFFGSTMSSSDSVRWSVQRRGAHLFITMTNDGDKRIRLSELKLYSRDAEVTLSPGLLGYVLAHSTQTRAFSVPASVAKIGEDVSISAVGESGPISGRVRVEEEG